MRPTLQRIVELFDYDPETGVIIRKFKGGQRKIVNAKRRKDGGTIRIDGNDYKAHRVAWLIYYGEWPTLFIDHINRNPADNRICNLRQATDAENKRNVGRRSHNTSGYKGVTWDPVNNKWLAHATYEGKGYHLGRYSNIEEAAMAYKNFAQVRYGEFYREE